MKKSIYLIAIALITIGCIIAGTMIHYGDGDWSGSRKWNGRGRESELVVLDSFDKMIVDTEVADVIIKEGTEYSIQYRYTKRLEPQYKVEQGTLYLEQEKKDRFWPGIGERCTIWVTVPEGTELATFQLNSDVGETDIEGLTIQEFNVNTDVGDLTATQVVIENGIIETDTGDVTVMDCSFQNLDVQGDVGDIEIESRDDLSNYEFDVETDVGEIEINDEEYGRKYKQKGDAGRLVVRKSVGDIEIYYR